MLWHSYTRPFSLTFIHCRKTNNTNNYYNTTQCSPLCTGILHSPFCGPVISYQLCHRMFCRGVETIKKKKIAQRLTLLITVRYDIIICVQINAVGSVSTFIILFFAWVIQYCSSVNYPVKPFRQCRITIIRNPRRNLSITIFKQQLLHKRVKHYKIIIQSGSIVNHSVSQPKQNNTW